MTSAGTVDGGAGADDQLALQGDYTGERRLTFGERGLGGIETLVLLSRDDDRFGDGSAAATGYDLARVETGSPMAPVATR